MLKNKAALKTYGLVAAVLTVFILGGLALSQEKNVSLVMEGKKSEIITRSLTVKGLLEEQDIKWNSKDYINPNPDSLLRPGVTVYFLKSVPVEISVDDRLIKINHPGPKLEAIGAAGITVHPLDTVGGVFDKGQSPIRISIVRVREEIYETEEAIPFEKRRILDPELRMGQVKILEQGVPGLVKKKYLIHYENGKETGRQILTTQIIKEVNHEVTALGTKGTIMVASRSLVQPRKIVTLQATAYTHTGNTTFTGIYPRIGTVAVDPRVIPLGTKLWVEGYGFGIAQDTGGLIKGNIIDLFMNTEAECKRWGRRTVRVYILG